MNFAIFNYVGLVFIVKYLHVMTGIIWLGAIIFDIKNKNTAKNKFSTHVASTALLTGIIHIGLNHYLSFFSNWGISMQLGAALGIVMWANTMFMLAGKNSHYANLMLAIPAVFFMEAASHLGIEVNHEANRFIVAGTLALPILIAQGFMIAKKNSNAMDVKKAILFGLALLVALYLIFEFTTK